MFRPKNVADVMNGFAKLIKGLDDVAQTHVNHAADKSVKAINLQNEAIEHNKEAQKAANISKKLQELIS